MIFIGDFMKNLKIIGACTDLGVDVDGADKGPSTLIHNLNYNNSIIINKPYCIKSHNPKDLKKNLDEVNYFNTELFNTIKDIIKEGFFPITLGGDHSMAIASALASRSINGNIGIIWIDAHLDYNTFETTITGNLHGLPLAAINGICKPLTNFTNDYINPKNTVVVGYRAKESNKDAELNNIKKMGVTVFDDDYIKENGIEYTIKKAFEIALNGAIGVHVSYDLDVIAEEFAPGVSVPELGGFDLDTAYKVKNFLIDNINKIKSFDLVEFNPTRDINNKTLNIALNIINSFLK